MDFDLEERATMLREPHEPMDVESFITRPHSIIEVRPCTWPISGSRYRAGMGQNCATMPSLLTAKISLGWRKRPSLSRHVV